MLKLATSLFGSANDRALKRYNTSVEAINALENDMQALDEKALKAKTQEFRKRLADGENIDSLLVEAFAVVREASRRCMEMRHFDVQLIGGMVLHSGKIAEMKTGEGKTLVATLAVYLNALEGKGAHVVTVNDYLATRDSEWMGTLYTYLGLSVGCITSTTPDAERKAAYDADITYGTNNEFGFDYLRDNMKYAAEKMVQRPFNFAIVDEVDSILIDEARTPLIISGPSEGSTEMYITVDKLIPLLDEEDYEQDEKMRSVVFTDEGTEHVEEILRKHKLLDEDSSLYDANNFNLLHHVNQGLRAHVLFTKDKDYIIKDDKVILIDEFTGRMMDGRRFSEGLHQALEAKEGVTIQMENQTLASITFQNYFRLYPKLAGMTGTAMTEAGEFMEIYGLGVIEMPPNMPVERIDHNDKIYKSLVDKEGAIVAQIRECLERDQPVLVGTTSIEKSETLSKKLKKLKIPHNVLNARYHEQEAQIIAQAGRPGTVTIATNMAGRGTDIKLGGNLEMRIEQEISDDMPAAKREKTLQKLRDEIARDKKIVLASGGLYVIGTERHESRRIDNQLRGRSGRQGDPGASLFFISLEDDLMRVFGSEKIEPIIASKRIGLRDGEALIHPWLSKALERAQGRVENQHFEIRKNLLKFDNVMNEQRKEIYQFRREIMESDDIHAIVSDMRDDLIEELVARCMPEGSYAEQWDMESLEHEALRIFNIDVPAQKWAKEDGVAGEEIIQRLKNDSNKLFTEKARSSSESALHKVEQELILQILDQQWKEHLLTLDHLRQGISLRAFAQRDPLNEYKIEAFSHFEKMIDTINENIIETLSRVDVDIKDINLSLGPVTDPSLLKTAHSGPEIQPSGPITNLAFDESNPVTWGKTPRNAACPCGSGKKYKHCHGKI